jgi:hypothetical protein
MAIAIITNKPLPTPTPTAIPIVSRGLTGFCVVCVVCGVCGPNCVLFALIEEVEICILLEIVDDSFCESEDKTEDEEVEVEIVEDEVICAKGVDGVFCAKGAEGRITEDGAGNNIVCAIAETLSP